MKRWRVFACMVVVVLVCAACGRDDATKEQSTTPAPKSATTQPAGDAATVVEVTLSFVEPRFRPDPVVVQVGKPVQFKFSSADTKHTVVIETLDIEIEVPQKALQDSVLTKVVTPKETGTFRMFCRIHGRLPMEGKLVVAETLDR